MGPIQRYQPRTGGNAGGGQQQKFGQPGYAPRLRSILLSVTLKGINGATAVQGPAVEVPEGCTVEVEPLGANAGTVTFVTIGAPQAAITGPFEELIKGSFYPREINIRNLAHFFMNGSAGDGLRITIRRGPTA